MSGGSVMRETHIRMLCSVIKTDMVFESHEGFLIPFFDATNTSPIMHSEKLRNEIRAHTEEADAPYLLEDAAGCFYAGIKAYDGLMYMGPMCSHRLNVNEVRRMYEQYDITENDLRTYPVYSLTDIRNMILLTNSMLENTNLQNEELFQLNRLIYETENRTMQEKTAVQLRENQVYDELQYKHSFQEEALVVNAVMRGDSGEAIRLSESMDMDSSRLGSNDVQHFRSLAIVAITVCSRAAISAGVSPSDSYRSSGFYINKVNKAQDPAHILHYRNRSIEEMCSMVLEHKEKQRSSSRVERCKSYINLNFRYKIYIEDIAEHLGVSTSYLSRLFRSETGVTLQDYINSVRVDHASRLLMYSDMQLSDIAEYVGFPNQSYFGKVFRKFRDMTPKEYRDMYGSY